MPTIIGILPNFRKMLEPSEVFKLKMSCSGSLWLRNEYLENYFPLLSVDKFGDILCISQLFLAVTKYLTLAT